MHNPSDEWKFKLQRLPICVDRDVTHPCAREVVHRQCETVRVPSPVRLSNLNAVPLDAALLQVILQCCLSVGVRLNAWMRFLQPKLQE